MNWHDLGDVAQFSARPLTQVHLGRLQLAVTHKDGQFGVISGVCNHAGGPLGEGRLDGDYVVCPWHNWKYHRTNGLGEPGYEDDAAPAYQVRVEDGRLLVDLDSGTKRTRGHHEPHPLARKIERAPGGVRVAGLSTTNMDFKNPRFSTSDTLLQVALEFARESLGVETRLLRLGELAFRNCEGYYSKSAHACTWPCSITQMDPNDQMDQVYEAIIHWADVVLIATPIRWGSASSLYFRMAERLNCVQNQVTIANRVLVRNKVAAFIITGGQDNVQGVAGQMLTFFSELGFHFPQFPFIAHSRGWSAEDMERNVDYVMKSEELRDGARTLTARAVDTAQMLLDHETAPHTITRGGRKAHHLAMA
ncbi:MAG TPA: Rieske 2Fe-2S domain-containing protein [Gemmatimonadaceae bacterium]|nr:Rieske 2Fe-2S domain-containing protein [Gemmatimonadaceae bacterium]